MDTSWIITSVLGVIVLYLFYRRYRNKKSYWEERGVPVMKSSIFKTIKLLIFSKKTFLEQTIDMYKEHCGKRFVGYSLYKTHVLMVLEPELIQHILIKDFSHFEDRSLPLDDKIELANLGLASLTGNKWRVLRHKMMPTFTSGKMKMMFSQIRESSDEFVLYVKSKKGQDLETRDFLFRYVMNVIARTAFGMKVNAFDENNQNENAFLQNSKNFFKPSYKLQAKMIIFTLFPKLKDLLKLRMVDTAVNDFFFNLTKDLIKQRQQSGSKRNDFLQLMLDQRDKELTIIENSETTKDASTDEGKELEERELFEYLKGIKYDKDATVFTDEMIAAQTFLFISGGTETTSAVLSFACHELAVNQDIQRKLQAEIDSVLSTQEFNYDAVKKMKYLEQVLNEVLRLRSPGTVLMRICVQDYKLPDSDVVLEKGCFIQIPAVGLQRDPQYFTDPEIFNPDRFDDMDSIPKGVFLPFGGGPRICIAMRLAMLEMKVFLATVLSSFNIVQSEKTPLPLVMDRKSMLSHVQGGLWVRFEER